MPLDNFPGHVESARMTDKRTKDWIVSPDDLLRLAQIAWPGQHTTGLAQCLGLRGGKQHATRYFYDKDHPRSIAISEENLRKVVRAALDVYHDTRPFLHRMESALATYQGR